jgi:hypothetical protein
MPGTPSGKSIVLEIGGRGGGGYRGLTTPEDTYGYSLWKEGLAYKRADEERKQKAEDIAQKREELAQRTAERRDRYEQRQLQRQDDLDSALDLIGTKLSNPASMHFQDNYEEIMGDPLVHRAMASKDGRMSIMGMLKEQHDAHQDYLDGWNKIASNYGADVSDLAVNKATGEVDWKNSLPVLNQKLQQKHEADVMKRAQGQAEAFRTGAVPKEISPEGEVAGYKVVKGLRPKVMTLDPSIQDHRIIAQSYLDKSGGDKKKARELAKKDGYTF